MGICSNCNLNLNETIHELSPNLVNKCTRIQDLFRSDIQFEPHFLLGTCLFTWNTKNIPTPSVKTYLCANIWLWDERVTKLSGRLAGSYLHALLHLDPTIFVIIHHLVNILQGLQAVAVGVTHAGGGHQHAQIWISTVVSSVEGLFEPDITADSHLQLLSSVVFRMLNSRYFHRLLLTDGTVQNLQ